ncbi:MAG: hypothetical protein GWN00_01270 [Aliifodinibius sp.]|nr:hypothetical protein [Fodinibius sp.]NIV09962.1 hypothetical protein [Fodinibius sp.]NIY23492.1 hypothetical protein [Fodinibius sp.]
MQQSLMHDHITRHYQLYAPEVLQPTVHFRLVENLQRFTSEAGIAKKYAYQSMSAFAKVPEIDWMRKYKSHRNDGVYGICFVKAKHCLPRMSAMVGACLRNYISAKVITLSDLIEGLKKGVKYDQDFLAIPNFALSQTAGGDIASWQVPALLSLLLDRAMQEKYTAVYIHSISAVNIIYGKSMVDHLNEYFTMVSE